MEWTQNPDGTTTCQAHGQTFRAGSATCKGCDGDPSWFQPLQPAAELTDLQREQMLISSEMRSLAKRFDRAARDRLEGGTLAADARGDSGGTSKDELLACKLADVAIKANRLAVEAAQPVATQRHREDMVRKYRVTKGKGPAS